LLKSTKLLLLRAWKRAGVLERVRDSRWRRKRLVILCYHGISSSDEHEWDGRLYMPPALFRGRLQLLKQGGYRVLPLPEAVRALVAGSLPERSVVLTFDDGFQDFSAQACPALSAFVYPATVYLTTYYCGYQRPVFDPACSYILWKGRGRMLDGAGILEGSRLHSLDTAAERMRVCGAIKRRAAALDLTAEQKDDVLRLLAERLSVDYPDLARHRTLHVMSPAEVAGLPADTINVELHTHRHRTPGDRDLFLREIIDNRQSIEAMRCGTTPVEHFCYPSGDHRPEFLPWLREAGVVSATTGRPGVAAPASNLLLLPRIVDTMNLTPLEFEACVTGAGAFLPHRG